MPSAVYCTANDIDNRLSTDGITYRVDDTPPDALGGVIDDASDEVEEYCLGHYESAQLSGNTWVTGLCADIAAELLCERRGNPVPIGIARKAERARKKLEDVLYHGKQIPGASQRRAAAPRLKQGRYRLDPVPHPVVERSRSVGEAEGYVSRQDRLDYLDYVI